MTSFITSFDTPRTSWGPGSRSLASPTTAFDSVNSAPAEALLKIVSDGNVLVADLLRLSAALPPALAGGASPSAPVLFDFRYLKDPEAHERRVEADRQSAALDDRFREAHAGVVEDVFRWLERVLAYHGQLTEFLARLQSGAFIHASVESLLLAPDHSQLLVEAVHLLGSLLLLLDRRLGSPVRERVVVAYFRLKGGVQAAGPNINRVISLCGPTGYTPNAKWLPAGYPDSYFARLPLPADVIAAILSHLRSDDLYHQVVHFPSPEHRSTALAQQAACLYTVLFFAPDVLHRDAALMRVLVDKHFVDNWVLAWAPGITSDIAEEWASHKAAKTALRTVITPLRARELAAAHTAALPDLRAHVAALLVEGVLSEDYVLQNTGVVLDCLRACNVAVRWLMLATASRQAALAESVRAAAPDAAAVAALLLDTSLLEYEVKRVYAALLESKEERWDQCRGSVADCLRELAEHHGGEAPASRRASDANLSAWFTQLADQVDELTSTGPSSNRAIRQVQAALAEVEGYHAVEGSLQSKQLLGEARGNLSKMNHISHIREEVLATLATVSDFSYAWGIIDAYTPVLQAQVRSDPKAVLKLRCLFLKLRSMLELPLLRIGQDKSPAAARVGDFYSASLLTYVRKVLQAVPATVLALVDRIVRLQEAGMPAPPPRLPKAQLRDFAQLPQRAELAALTDSIAALAHGVLAMERTFMGVMDIDPLRLLEDGIRSQIGARIARTATAALSFQQRLPSLGFGDGTPGGGAGSALVQLLTGGGSAALKDRHLLQQRLSELAARLEGLQRSFECIQDCVRAYSPRLWHQEFAAFVRSCVAREAKNIRPGGTDAANLGSSHGAQPRVQMIRAPQPSTPIGRVVGELLRLSDPALTCYDSEKCCWRDQAGEQTLNLDTFGTLGRALGVFGLEGIDRLLGLRAAEGLRLFDVTCHVELAAGAAREVHDLVAAAAPLASTPEQGMGVYTEAAKKLNRLFASLTDLVVAVGQAHLLRQRIAMQLRNMNGLGSSGALTKTLDTLNAAVLAAVPAGAEQSIPAGSALMRSELLPELSRMLTAAGLHEPRETVYLRAAALPELPPLLALLITSALPRYAVSATSGRLLVRRDRRPTGPDPAALTAGLAVLLRQHNPAHLQVLLQHTGQMARLLLASATDATARGMAAAGVEVGLPEEVGVLITMLEEVCRWGGWRDSVLSQHLPPLVLDLWPAALPVPTATAEAA